MKPIIQTKNLCKIFRGGIDAVQDVSLTVYPGELFGLFGPNGAGKSTIVRLLSPSSGRATVNGFDVVADEIEVRASIGLVSADERSFLWAVNGRSKSPLLCRHAKLIFPHYYRHKEETERCLK